MYEDKQPLLDQKTILLMGEIDEELFRQFCWSLHHLRAMYPSEPILLQITSYGGALDIALAMVDMIQADGHIWGVTLGKAASSAMDIWAACAQRYVGQTAVLGVHQASFADRTNLIAKDCHMMALELQRRNEQVAELYASASNKDRAYWLKVMDTTATELVTYDFEDMLLFEMARPYEVLKADLVRRLLPVDITIMESVEIKSEQ